MPSTLFEPSQAQRPMLCTSCQNKPHCLPAQMAQGDATLAELLGQLKRCGISNRRRSTPWQRLGSLWQFLKERFAKGASISR